MIRNMLKSRIWCLIAIALFGIVSLNGQSQQILDNCLFDQMYNRGGLDSINQIIITNKFDSQENNWTENLRPIKVIPVVFHVIHQGGRENISLEQIDSQIKVLNEDFGKKKGSNGDGKGVDTRVRFCRAKIDPSGNCTDGIVRVNSKLSSHKSHERAKLKDLSFWNNKNYLNFYIVGSINGNVGGYASFPGAPDDADGIVVRHNLVGTRGTSSTKGRTATHELGHWLGLYHTFNNGCGTDTCTDGDYVCDTPPVALPNRNCVIGANSCNNDLPDVPDQIENYMDYTSDNCQNSFTEGQSDRIHSTLDNIRTNIWKTSNLISTGCDSNYVAPRFCNVIADFVSLNRTICLGSKTQFHDKSLNTVISWQWRFEGGTPSTSTLQNPEILYSNPGGYEVSLTVADSNGKDSITFNNYINVVPKESGNKLPFFEGFEIETQSLNQLRIDNLDSGITWEIDSTVGRKSRFSIKIDNLINTNYGSADELVLPPVDFSSIHIDSSLYLQFDWAYAKSDPTFSDQLLVLMSTDCGLNYIPIFNRSQSALATGMTQTTPFVPDSSEWKNINIDLSPFRTENRVLLKFVNVTDGGNNLYLDNIYVGDGTMPTFPTSIKNIDISKQVIAYPNPTSTKLNINLIGNQSIHEIRITNIMGGIVYEKSFLKKKNNINLSVDKLPIGSYFIQLKTNVGHVYNKKIVISR